MDLLHLKTFRMVASLLSFSRAASALDYAQSTITAHVQALESELGVPLFNRLGRYIELTEAGERLFNYSEQILDLAEVARAAVSEQPQLTGILTIGAPETICTYRLPVILKRFRQQAPQVRLIFRPMHYDNLYDQAREGKIDVAFLLEQTVNAPNLNIETLICESFALIAPPDHPLADKSVLDLRDLAQETLLLTERGCGYRNVFEYALSEAGVWVGMNMEFSSVEAIKQCVMAGIGIALLPMIAVENELQTGELIRLAWHPPQPIYTQMIWHRDKWLSPALQTFLDLSRQLMRGE